MIGPTGLVRVTATWLFPEQGERETLRLFPCGGHCLPKATVPPARMIRTHALGISHRDLQKTKKSDALQAVAIAIVRPVR